MARPSTSLATLRPDLAASVEEFNLANDRQGFIGLRVLPVFEAAKSGGSFGRIPIAQLLQNREIERTSTGGYSRGSWKFEPDSYATIERGAEEPIDDNDAENYRDYFEVEQISASRAYDAVLRGQESRVANLLFNPGTFTPAPVDNEWDDYENATPIDDVEAAIRAIWARTGLWPNALILDQMVFRNLRNCKQIIERIQSGGTGRSTMPGDITAAMLANLFLLSNVIVAGSPKNTAAEGQPLAIGPIWDNEYALVTRLCQTNDIREPGLGRTFHWDADGSQVGGAFETYREESIRGDVVRVRHQVGEKLILPAGAELLSNITTPAE